MREPHLSPGIPSVFAIDSAPLFRMGLGLLVEREGWKLVGEASTVEEAIDSLSDRGSDLIVVDLPLGAGDGTSLLASLRCASPDSNILVVANRDEPACIESFLIAGAQGYVCKAERAETIAEALRTTMAGRIYVDQRTSEAILERIAHRRTPLKIEESLTPREREIYDLIGQGQSVKQIAGTLRLSAKTIEYHRQQMKKKLGLKSSGELARHALVWKWEAELADDPPPSAGDSGVNSLA